MADDQQKLLTRRAFARRAALVSASAALVSDGAILASHPQVSSASQYFGELPKLSPEGQAEAEARFQLVLSRHGSRLTEEDKHNIKILCFLAQPGLDRLRSFSLKNGDVPALFLKPIVERDKIPQSSRIGPSPAATPKHP